MSDLSKESYKIMNNLLSHAEQIVINYDGQALAEHKIDLDVLADSLQGLNSLLKEVNVIVNGTSDDFSVDVQPFREGSFEYLIDVIQNPAEHLNILAIIGLTSTAAAAAGRTLIDILLQIKGRQIRKMVLTAEGDCKIILEDGEEIVAPSYFRFLLSSTSIRKSLSKLIHNPLQKDGYDVFKINNASGDTIVAVGDDDKESFKYRSVPVERASVDREEYEVVVTFLTIHKDKSAGWRIEYNGEPVTATIEDQEFLQRVKTGREPGIFSDAYTVDLLIRENLNSLDKAYIVVRVHRDL